MIDRRSFQLFAMLLAVIALIWASTARAEVSEEAPAPEAGASGASTPIGGWQDMHDDPRPIHQLLRFDEDWSVLREFEPDEPTDLFDPIKYIPLDPDGDCWLSFGGQARTRLEVWENFRYAPQNDDVFLLTRLRAHADLHIGRNFRTYVEGTSAFSTTRDLPGGRRTTDTDELDLVNGFADLKLFLFDDDATLTLRGGRFQMLFGRGRLVGPDDWFNTLQTFDGGAAILDVSDWTLTGFWTRPVEVSKYEFNRSDDDHTFFGAYAAGVIPWTTIGLDLYWMRLDRRMPTVVPGFGTFTIAERRHSIGGRIHGLIGKTGLDYDIEGTYQVGEIANRDVRAYMFAGELGYSPWETVRIHGLLSNASGGDSGGDVEVFNQLFPRSHAFLGWIDAVGRQNNITTGVGVTWKARPNLTIAVVGYQFWRFDTDDALYNSRGIATVPGLVTGARDIGREIDLLVRWQVDRHLTASIGYSHFFTGEFLKEATAVGGRDIDFFHTTLQYTF